MEKLTNIWAELEKKKKLPSGPLTQSCQAELQELMRQLDIMLSSKKREWDRDMEALQAKLEMRDHELRLNTSTLQLKNKENEDLHEQMKSMNKVQKEIVQEYEGQLIELRSEVQKMKKEYEKLYRKYSKQTKDSHRLKEDVLSEINGSKSEITKLKEQLEEYQQKSRDWEQQRKMMKKEIECLRSQKKALEDKCDFIQQQSQTYQSQLGRRRQLQGDTEFSLKTKITQLEGQLERSNDVASQQQEKISKLKTSLNEALTAHKRAMNDNETLLEDVRKLNHNLRVTETEKSSLESDLESHDRLLRAAQEDCQQYFQRLTAMEQTLAAKDDVIKSLGNGVQHEVSEKVSSLQESLQDARTEIRDLRRKEKKLKDEVAMLENKLKLTNTRLSEITKQLHDKEEELDYIKNTQLSQLKSEIQKLTDRLSTSEDRHQAQLMGMKLKLSELTTEVHQRESAVVTMNEKCSNLELNLTENCTQLNSKTSELKVAEAQIESLQVENRHLRHDVMDKLRNVFDRVEAEHQLQTINDDYLNKITKLQQENRALQEDISRIQKEMTNMEQEFYNRLQATTVNSELTIQGLKANDQRERDQAEIARDHQFSTMQMYMDSTVRRHHDQIHLLESQKLRLQDQLQLEKRENTRLTDLLDEKNLSQNSAGTVLDSEPMSLLHSFVDLDSSRLSLDLNFDNSAEAAAEKFLSGEEERMKEFEKLIDSRIEEMKINMDTSIEKYHHR